MCAPIAMETTRVESQYESLMHILVGIFLLFGVLAPLVASRLCECCVYLV